MACHECAGIADTRLIDALLSHRTPPPDVNGADGDGDAPLHIVAREGGVAYARALIAREAVLALQIDKKNVAGATPLHIACVQGGAAHRVALVRALLSAPTPPQVNAPNPARLTPLQAVAHKQSPRVLDALLTLAPHADCGIRHPEHGGTLLHVVAASALASSVAPSGAVAALSAASTSTADAVAAATAVARTVSATDTMRVLLYHHRAGCVGSGAMLDVHAVDARGQTAVEVAVRRGDEHAETVRLLLTLIGEDDGGSDDNDEDENDEKTSDSRCVCVSVERWQKSTMALTLLYS